MLTLTTFALARLLLMAAFMRVLRKKGLLHVVLKVTSKQ